MIIYACFVIFKTGILFLHKESAIPVNNSLQNRSRNNWVNRGAIPSRNIGRRSGMTAMKSEEFTRYFTHFIEYLKSAKRFREHFANK